MGSPNPEKQGVGHLGFIEGLRGIAALYVVIGHFGTMVDPDQKVLRGAGQPQWLQWVMAPFWHGHLAVAAFIVISGYCLQLSLFARGDGSKVSAGRFLARRCERILPPYYACLALSLLVCWLVTSKQSGMPWEQYLPADGPVIWSHVLMVHNLSPEWMYKINGVLWSIGIEFQLYFAFPVSIWLLYRVGRLLTLAVAVGLAALLLAEYAPAVKLYVWYIPLFVLGAVAANLAFYERAPKINPNLYLVVAAVGFGFMAGFSGHKELLWSDVGVGLGTAALMAYCGRSRGSLTARWIGVRPLVALGAFSYSLYLMHHPILQVLFVIRPEWAATPARQMAYLWVLGLPIILASCWLFYLAFERPFVRSRRFKSG